MPYTNFKPEVLAGAVAVANLVISGVDYRSFLQYSGDRLPTKSTMHYSGVLECVVVSAAVAKQDLAVPAPRGTIDTEPRHQKVRHRSKSYQRV